MNIRTRRTVWIASASLFAIQLWIEKKSVEGKLKWTGFRFLERIRVSLAGSAKGELHVADQPPGRSTTVSDLGPRANIRGLALQLLFVSLLTQGVPDSSLHLVLKK